MICRADRAKVSLQMPFLLESSFDKLVLFSFYFFKQNYAYVLLCSFNSLTKEHLLVVFIFFSFKEYTILECLEAQIPYYYFAYRFLTERIFLQRISNSKVSGGENFTWKATHGCQKPHLYLQYGLSLLFQEYSLLRP